MSVVVRRVTTEEMRERVAMNDHYYPVADSQLHNHSQVAAETAPQRKRVNKAVLILWMIPIVTILVPVMTVSVPHKLGFTTPAWLVKTAIGSVELGTFLICGLVMFITFWVISRLTRAMPFGRGFATITGLVAGLFATGFVWNLGLSFATELTSFL